MNNLKLLFVETPPLPFDLNARLFRDLGFELEVYQFLDWGKILDIGQEIRQPLDEFDVIVLCFSRPDDEMPRQVEEQLRTIIADLAAMRSVPISVIGLCWGATRDSQLAQSKFFTGRFISRDSARSEMLALFSTIISRPLTDEEQLCIQQYFPT